MRERLDIRLREAAYALGQAASSSVPRLLIRCEPVVGQESPQRRIDGVGDT
jgi:hypothetical protein